MTYFCPTLDPPLGGSSRKTTTLVRDHEYFIPTKFHQNPSSGSGEEVENVNCLTDEGWTDDGQRMITIGHWSLWLLCPKNGEDLKRNMTAKKYQWSYTMFACSDRSNHDKIDAGQLIIGPREYPFPKMFTCLTAS